MSASIPLAFETWPIDRLIEYARNPRKNEHAVIVSYGSQPAFASPDLQKHKEQRDGNPRSDR